ncbi:37S ribosomal protein S5-like protein [Emericellopsis cladophorae]|uniref:37S ribosomal protein S5-like protein n=1 Tax=Emericellopsis cladophorae TaxID=2686198 RepID=A0A9Q0BEP9_9HYPO|nr:37S ribosomal protein S5-like protein [Emericellopsis cladophorae]KAI6781835.1 37S ribosomal protein S5-like protein [Emericellopsis cladophorae]
MSVSRPAARRLVGRCLSQTRTQPPSSTPYAAAAAAAAQCLPFHSSASCSKPRRSQFRNVKASELGLTNAETLQAYKADKFGELTPEELDKLRQKYTPEQMEALLAGEKAVDPDDMIFQGRLRDDIHRPTYMDDYAVMDPRYDVKPEAKITADEPLFPTEQEYMEAQYKKMTDLATKSTNDMISRSLLRAMRKVRRTEAGMDTMDLTEAELDDMERDPSLIERYVAKLDEDGVERYADDMDTAAAKAKGALTRGQATRLNEEIDAQWQKEFESIFSEDSYELLRPAQADLAKDAPDGLIHATTAEQPDTGKIPGVEGKFRSEEDPDDLDGRYDRYKKTSGLSVKTIQKLYTKILATRNVANQTRLGKVRKASVIVLAGNGHGRLGIGMAKSIEPGVAREAAMGLAMRNMRPIRRYENRTIYGNVTAKLSGTVAELQSRPPGFGLRVPARIFEMCRAVGIQDLSVQLPRSKSPMNSVKAFYKALLEQPDPEEIAIGRGKKLVDVRKVYYGGSTA